MKNSFFQTNKYLFLSLVIVFAVGGFVQFYFDKDGIFQRHVVQKQGTYTPNTSAATGTGTPRIGGSFTLVDHNGNAFGSADLQGRYALINFGYASCPDVCIEGLTTMAEAYDKLPDALRANVQPVFITIDPERDTPARLAEYLPAFHKSIVGLTGTPEQIAEAAAKFLVYRAKRKPEEGQTEYLMDHSSFFYLMGPDGSYVMHYRHSVPPADMARQIAGAMTERG
jgi:protein SCO1/2